MKERRITLFGSAASRPGDGVWEEAERLGAALAGAGWALVNGGYGGTMEASAKGAREAGGRVIGVGVEVFTRKMNDYNSESILAPNLFDRIEKLLDLGDAYIALPGGSGTLVELGLAWEYAIKGFGAKKPLILYGDFWNAVADTIGRQIGMRPDGGVAKFESKWPPFVHSANSPEEVLALLADWHQ